MRKKFMKCIAAAALTVAGAATAVFPVMADSPVKSRGNLVYEKEAVSLCAADFDYLYAEADGLQKEQGLTELPDVSTSDAGRKDALSSRGVINYADGAVVMDSSDFIRLADWLDGLDAAYENSTADAVKALRQIGTYFMEDGTVTHEPEKAAGSDGNALKLPYSKIGEGILQSQSVAYLAEQGIVPAIADNLSRGTAAWVDGCPVIGNGADNDAFYNDGYSAGEEAGYQTGYAMGAKDAEENVNPSSASYREGYAQGKADSKPVILTGTIRNFESTASELFGSVQIPAGLSYVCAGINVSSCATYMYPEVSVWNVSTSWKYDKSTGLVSFGLGLGGEKHPSSAPAMNYTIMYIP
ncbi:MAG: hypothetical protein HDR27_06570 [Lachnospiraceae bacterium]|nr:hypothetical protein [Lachnospiraceae bacterium]